MLSFLVDLFPARDLPTVLLCGIDAMCWQLPENVSTKGAAMDLPSLLLKLVSNVVLAAVCVLGARGLGEEDDEEGPGLLLTPEKPKPD